MDATISFIPVSPPVGSTASNTLPTEAGAPVKAVATELQGHLAVPQANSVQTQPDQASSKNSGEHPSGKDLASAVKNINDFMQQVRRELKFTVNKDTGQTVVQVVDADSNKVIRQMPADYLIKLAETLDKGKGILFRGSA